MSLGFEMQIVLQSIDNTPVFQEFKTFDDFIEFITDYFHNKGLTSENDDL